jgi:uncharacterized protein YyaL (SSP411 family)
LANHLINETSPYLLQHAHNPVDWYPWGDEAIRRAREEDKPMLVSIGYSACHWCHVMERESFEDPETAEIMNRHFINIKIDREERPDLDQIYMDAVQAIAGNGGWPLNVFLTPEAKPFYGGTYFPPTNLHNRPSWKSVLQGMAIAFREKRKDVEEQATHLTNHIAGSAFGIKPVVDVPAFKKEDLQEVYENLMKTADQVEGGFGQAPKFPQTFSIRFLLQHHYYNQSADSRPSTVNRQPSTDAWSSKALEQACLSLDKMIRGGIYYQLGGGFARYSTDNEWLAPHFEKMLYDNALLIIAMSEAFQYTGKAHYEKAIAETMDFIEKELSSPEGGFFSALDADSEGEEGKYYIWQKNEIDRVLGADSDAFCRYYDVSERGNWEGKNILRIKYSASSPSAEKEQEWKNKLRAVRDQRVKPALDDKILLGWNALMIAACCKAFAALDNKSYLNRAILGIQFLEEKMQGSGIHHFYHSYKNGKATIPAFLDDYAYLVDAYIQLQEVTGDTSYLMRAKRLTDWVIEHFSEEETGYFYYTHKDQDDVILRKREVYDGATPSGNAVMSANLLYLGIVFDLNEWKGRAINNVGGLKDLITKYPGSFGVWATLLNAVTYSMYEIVLAGDFSREKHLEFLAKPIPNRIFQLASVTLSELPLLGNKPVQGPSQFFLCRNYSCQQPVTEVAELIGLLKNS